MVLPHSSGDLYHKYRPLRFSEIVGHEEVVKSIKSAITSDAPSKAYLLIGESGTGKTTTARIMALTLNCLDLNKGDPCLTCVPCKSILSGTCIDVIEKNAAEHRGIDAIREISSSMSFMPLYTKNKIYILDEAHQISGDGQASLLKVLEEAPKNVFIILCTTHVNKVLPTVRNRCQQFRFNPLPRAKILSLLEEVVTYETVVPGKDVLFTIAEAASGSPRQALVFLQQTLQLDKPTASQVKKLIDVDESDPNAIELCFKINQKTTWAQLMGAYKNVSDLGAPAIGMVVAGFFRNRLIGSKSKLEAEKLAKILEFFVVPFDSGKLGENQLILSLYKALTLVKS